MPVEKVIWFFWGMRLHHRFSDCANSRHQPMEGPRNVVVGSAVGGFLGAAGFFAMERWIPMTGDAEAWEEKLVPQQIVSKGNSPNAAPDKLREACLSGAFFERGEFEQSVCKQFR